MNGKVMEFDVFHVHIAQDVIAGIGHYPIFNLWSFGGGGSSQAMVGVYLLYYLFFGRSYALIRVRIKFFPILHVYRILINTTNI